MASPGDDMSKFDQFELYQQAEEQFDNELSPDRWGPGYMFTEDNNWAGVQNHFQPEIPSQNPFSDYFDAFERAPTIEAAMALPIPGCMPSDLQTIPAMQFASYYSHQPVQHFPQQSMQQFPQQGMQQHLQYHRQQALQQPHDQAVLQHPQQAQQVAQAIPRQVLQPTPRLDHQRIPSQGYNHPSRPIHPQIPPNVNMGANAQAIPVHHTPQDNLHQISPSGQSHMVVANTQTPHGSMDAPNQTTPRSQSSGDSQPRSAMHEKPRNAEQNADANISPYSEDTQATAVTANEIRRGHAGGFAEPQQPDDTLSERTESPVTQGQVHDNLSDRRQEFCPPAPTVGRPAMGSMITEGGLVVGPCQIPNFVPDIEELLNPVESGVDTQTIFKNSKDSRKAMHVHRPDLLSQRDHTIPTTDEQKRAIVKALFNAMKSLVHAEDNPAMKRPFVQGKYTDARLEAACWTLLDLTLLRHRRGPLLGAFSDKCRGGEAIASFGQRISLIITGLEVNKTIVKHVLDPNYTASLVDDPVGSMKRIVSNKQLNRRKGEYMTAGKQLLQNEQENYHSGRSNQRRNARIQTRADPVPTPVEMAPVPVQTVPAPVQTSGVMTRRQARRANSDRTPSPSRTPNTASRRSTMHPATTGERPVVHTRKHRTHSAQYYPANYPLTPTRHAPTETHTANGGYMTPAQHSTYHPLGGLPVSAQPAPHPHAPMDQNNLATSNDDVDSQGSGGSSPLFGDVGYGCVPFVASTSPASDSRPPSAPHNGHRRKRRATDAGFGSGLEPKRRR